MTVNEPSLYPDRSLHSRVVNSLGRSIIAGTIPIGTPLPTETELMEAFSVSRTVIREATKILAGKGLIETKTRLGSRVKPSNSWHLLDPDVVAWRYVGGDKLSDFIELIQLRELIEPGIAGLAAIQATKDDLEHLHRCYEAMEAAENEPDAFSQADQAFHEALVEAVRNDLLRYLYHMIGSGLSELRAITVKGRKHEIGDTKLHKVVLDAICASDKQGAIEAMQEIVLTSRREVMTYFGQRSEKV